MSKPSDAALKAARELTSAIQPFPPVSPDILKYATQRIDTFADQKYARLKQAVLAKVGPTNELVLDALWEDMDDRGDGAPDSNPFNRRMLEYAAWAKALRQALQELEG